MVPDQIKNLKVQVDPKIPSVTLNWAPPQNLSAGTPSFCSMFSRYHIRFKPKGRQHYNEIDMDWTTTGIVLNRETGLTPHTTFTFEVRAQCGEDVGQWRAVSAFFRKLRKRL